jgi:hypothetical protein
MLVCHNSMYDCLRSESESASHSSPPQLKGVRVISACARTLRADSCRACERDKLACMHMHVCMHVPTAAQPHLKGV